MGVLQDPIQATVSSSYYGIEVNETTFTVLAEDSAVCLKQNNGAIVVKGNNNIIVMHENRGTIDIEGFGNNVRIINKQSIGVIRNRNSSSFN